jgi:hypothetical protein
MLGADQGRRGPMADQRGLQRREADGHGRAGADRDARLPHRAVRQTVEDRRDHDDGDHQIAPRAELQEAAFPRSGHGRHVNAQRQFVVAARGAPVAQDEVADRQFPRSAERGENHPRVERQQVRHAVGGGAGVAQVADQRAPVLDLHAAHLPRRRAQPVERRRQIGRDQVGPGGAAGDEPAVRPRRDPAQPVQRRDVENVLVRRRPEACRKMVGATREDGPAPLRQGG